MDGPPIAVLLIEDNPGDVRLISELMSESRSRIFSVESCTNLHSGLERLQQPGIDLVLLDLSLPDSHGHLTLAQLPEMALHVPVIVLTGSDDEQLAIKAVQAGAQDYLVKGNLTGQLLIRSIRYAIERHTLLLELEHAREKERRDREIRSLEELSSESQTPITARLFGRAPLRDALPAIFEQLTQTYAELLELTLEQRAYKVDHQIGERLRTMGEQLGFLKAGPRDVIEIHSTALRRSLREVSHARAQAYVEEGRLTVLELMGHLASFYRVYSLGARSLRPREMRWSGAAPEDDDE